MFLGRLFRSWVIHVEGEYGFRAEMGVYGGGWFGGVEWLDSYIGTRGGAMLME